MAVFGLTGSLASGKSSVLVMLKEKGVNVFDADQQVHKYYRNKKGGVYRKVAKKFPQCTEGGRINRKLLRETVFSDKAKLKALEEIVHPQVIKDLLIWIRKNKKRKGVYVAEVALLFEKGLQGVFDGVILVNVKRSVLIDRIIKKYKFSKGEARRRLSLYRPIREKIKGADYIVDNNSNLSSLKKEVDLLWKKIR